MPNLFDDIPFTLAEGPFVFKRDAPVLETNWRTDGALVVRPWRRTLRGRLKSLLRRIARPFRPKQPPKTLLECTLDEALLNEALIRHMTS